MQKNHRKIFISAAIAFFLLANSASATMESRSYVIFDNINQKFDGPIISNVSVGSVTDTEATITWNTDFPSDSFVVYDLDSAFSGKTEQGVGGASRTSHSVVLSGLTPSKSYYFKVKSTRANGGTTYGSVGTFSTGAATTQPIPPAGSIGGGGVLIIDKTDKQAPQILNLTASDITDSSAVVTWTTDEPATSFVEFGKTTAFGGIFGEWSEAREHRIVLDRLDSATTYHLRALSSDAWGNVGRSQPIQITTVASTTDEQEVKGEEEQKNPITDQKALAEASARVIELMGKLQNQVSLNVLQNTLFTQYSAIERLANIIPAPILSGEPRVELTADSATIYWTTDKNANSLIAYAEDARFDKKKTDPYQQVVGDPVGYVKDHKVALYNLKPNTVYHYQLRSKAAIGPTGTSQDFTFKTRLESLEITSLFPEVVDPNTANIKWVTNKDADSEIVYTPYRNNVLSVDESKTLKDGTRTALHQMRISDFQSGVVYDIQVKSTDKDGNVAQDQIAMFTTGEDTQAPEISFIKTDSTIYSDKSARTQTIISWKTDEQSTGQIYYQEGVVGNKSELKEKTDINPSYAREHLFVVTKFKPGTVYSFKVVSADSSGNTGTSTVHTFMTPRQKDSIIQVIIRILEETFGWTRKLM